MPNDKDPFDITYCSYAGCPKKGCSFHPSVLKKLSKQFPHAMVSTADYSGSCREYIRLLVQEVLP